MNTIMKVLIYGANGWIGSQFCDIMTENHIKFIIGISRVDNELQLKQEIKKVNPSHIISFIGRTHGKINDKIYLYCSGLIVIIYCSYICFNYGLHFN